jgi:hypothetical protein
MTWWVTMWSRRRRLPASALARRLDRHPVRAVVVLDWLVWGGGLL